MIKETDRKSMHDSRNYQRTKMQRDIIIQRLKEKGCRVTKQRLMLLDIILEEECSCCKEIYYKASKIDGNIGTATVYRMINTLEEIGAISRKNMYKISCGKSCDVELACSIDFSDGSVAELNAKQWFDVIHAGLEQCGILHERNIISIQARQCDCDECGHHGRCKNEL
ncbi:MAG: transcriptional repressor [Lachnospiraceae bacterium]|nr:transcriptional repressor [Lachnospiraceae bacterium]